MTVLYGVGNQKRLTGEFVKFRQSFEHGHSLQRTLYFLCIVVVKGVAVKWLEWVLWFHLIALVVIAELFSLASLTMLLVWLLRKKWRWLFHH